MLIWPSPLSPLGDWGKSKDGPNRRISGEVAPNTFYRSLLASALETLRCEKMTFGASEVRANSPPFDNLSSEMSKQGFGAVDLLSAFAKADGSAMDLTNRLSPEFDLKEELLSGRVKFLTKTAFLAPHGKKMSKHTPCCYNWFSKQRIWNYETSAFAKPVNDWRPVSYKSICDNLGSLMEMSLVNAN